MTNREFLTSVSTLTNVSEELVAFAKAALDKMDATNAARKNKPSKTAIENAPLVDKIVHEVLGTEPMTASDIAEVIGVSTQKASALMRQIVAHGDAVATDIKLPKKGTCKAYSLVEAE